MSQQSTWLQEYVSRNAPGPATPLQQQRQRVMQEILPELYAWFGRHGFQAFEERFKPSAYFGSLSMLDVAGAQLMSRYTGWLFFLDACTDESPSEEELEKRTRQIVLPFTGRPGASDIQKTEAPGLEHHLAESFEELRQELARLRGPSLDAASLGFCLSVFSAEASAVVRAMSWERLQSLRYIANGRRASPISLEDYLRVGRYSISVRAAAALSLAYEREPQLAWSRWQHAMDAGADALRLVNDLANIQREFEEGKLNAISISLLNDGWDGQTPPAPDSPQLAKAIAAVRQRLADELRRFTQEIQALPSDGALYTNVVSAVAFTIAMYQRGDFLIPSNSES